MSNIPLSPEFNFINQLKNLSFSKAGYDNLNFEDDISIISPHKEGYLIGTKDVLVEKIHFFSEDPLDIIIKKAIRVNISDLAAKGATPYGMFLGLCLPDNKMQHHPKILQALEEECQKYTLPLLGGDTVRSEQLTVSITLLGTTPAMPPLRKNAKIGETIYVTGILGQSATGLKIRLGEKVCKNEEMYLHKYLLPDPPLAVGKALCPYMSASCDISDGLLLDLQNILLASRCGAILEYPNIPKVTAFQGEDKNLEIALTGGDDYEILFTSSASDNIIQKISETYKHPITPIGTIIEGDKIQSIPDNLPFFNHFSDRSMV